MLRACVALIAPELANPSRSSRHRGDLEALAATWDGARRSRAIRAPPFRSWAWISAWWKSFSAGREPVVLVAATRGAAVGLLPAVRRALAARRPPPRLHGRRHRRLRLPRHRLAAPSDAAAAGARLRRLTSRTSPRRARASTASCRDDPLLPALTARLPRARAAVEPRYRCPHITLARRLRRATSARCPTAPARNCKRRLRWLEKRPGYRLECADRRRRRSSRGARRALRLHHQRWAVEGGSDAIDSPTSRRSIAAPPARSPSAAGRASICLHVEGAPRAALYGLRHGDRFAFYQAGYDPDWRQRSVGTVLLGHDRRVGASTRARPSSTFSAAPSPTSSSGPTARARRCGCARATRSLRAALPRRRPQRSTGGCARRASARCRSGARVGASCPQEGRPMKRAGVATGSSSGSPPASQARALGIAARALRTLVARARASTCSATIASSTPSTWRRRRSTRRCASPATPSAARWSSCASASSCCRCRTSCAPSPASLTLPHDAVAVTFDDGYRDVLLRAAPDPARARAFRRRSSCRPASTRPTDATAVAARSPLRRRLGRAAARGRPLASLGDSRDRAPAHARRPRLGAARTGRRRRGCSSARRPPPRWRASSTCSRRAFGAPPLDDGAARALRPPRCARCAERLGDRRAHHRPRRAHARAAPPSSAASSSPARPTLERWSGQPLPLLRLLQRLPLAPRSSPSCAAPATKAPSPPAIAPTRPQRRSLPHQPQGAVGSARARPGGRFSPSLSAANLHDLFGALGLTHPVDGEVDARRADEPQQDREQSATRRESPAHGGGACVLKVWPARTAAPAVAFFGLLAFILIVYANPGNWFDGLDDVGFAKIAAGLSLAALVGSWLLYNRRLTIGGRRARCSSPLRARRLLARLVLWPKFTFDTFTDGLKYLAVFLLVANVVDSEARLATTVRVLALASVHPGARRHLVARARRAPGRRRSRRLDWHLRQPQRPRLPPGRRRGHGARRARRRAASRLRKLAWLVAVGADRLRLLLTQSRGGMFAGLASCCSSGRCARSSARRSSSAPRASLGAAGLHVAQQPLARRTDEATAYGEDVSARGRIDAWRTGLDIAKDRPFTGVGAGAFMIAWPEFAPGDAGEVRTRAQHVHPAARRAGHPGALLFLGALGAAALGIVARRTRQLAAAADRARRRSAAWPASPSAASSAASP